MMTEPMFLIRRFAAAALLAGALATGVAGPALAKEQRTPKSFNYDIKDGKPVPRGEKVTNPDGSWREVLRQGRCTTIKEKTASGEFRTKSECSPK